MSERQDLVKFSRNPKGETMRGQIFAAAFIGLSFAASAEPIVRYAAVDGTGDGTSWGKAASLADAYSVVGDNADGGEVWLKTGVYQVMTAEGKGIALTMLSNVGMIGGFKGDESVASSADPVANPVIITPGGDGTCWATNRPGMAATTTKIRSGLTLNYPPDELYPEAKGWCAGTDYGRRCVFLGAREGVVTNCFFRGLSFVDYQYRVISLDSTVEADVIRFKNCRFWACGSIANTGGTYAIYIGNGSAEVTDCEFVGSSNCITVNSATSELPCTVHDCVFKHCNGYYGGAASAICVTGKATPDIRNCLFDRCAVWGLSSSQCGIAYLGDADHQAVPTVVSNCCFRQCYLECAQNTWGTLTLQRGTGSLTEIVDCQFVGNTNIQTAARGNCQSACIAVQCLHDAKPHHQIVRNCSFIGNAAVRINDPGFAYGSASVHCVGIGIGCHVTFVNCTMEDNTARAPDGNACCGRMFYGWRQGSLALVNCVLANNDCYADDGKTRREAVYDAGAGQTIAFVNTVFWHAAKDFIPFPDKSYYCFASSDIFNSPVTSATSPTSNAYVYNLFNDIDPQVGPELAAAATTGVQQRRLAPASPMRKKGRPVWRGSDGYYYIYDSVGRATTPWRRVDDKGTCLNDEQAAAVGLSLAADPIADALGAPRVEGKIALGPLNTDPLGLMLLVH